MATDGVVRIASLVLQNSSSKAAVLRALGASVSVPPARVKNMWLGIPALAGTMDSDQGCFTVCTSVAVGVSIQGSVEPGQAGTGCRVRASVLVSRGVVSALTVLTLLLGAMGIVAAGTILLAPDMHAFRLFAPLPLLWTLGIATLAQLVVRAHVIRAVGCFLEVLTCGVGSRVETATSDAGMPMLVFLTMRLASRLGHARVLRPRAVVYWARLTRRVSVVTVDIRRVIRGNARCALLAAPRIPADLGTPCSFRYGQLSPVLLGSTIADVHIGGEGGVRTAVVRFGVQVWEVAIVGSALAAQLGWYVAAPQPFAFLGVLNALVLVLLFGFGCRASQNRAQLYVEQSLSGGPGESSGR